MNKTEETYDILIETKDGLSEEKAKEIEEFICQILKKSKYWKDIQDISVIWNWEV